MNYLPNSTQQYLLLGGLNDQYRSMYEASQKTTKEYLLYRAMIKDSTREVLFTGGFRPMGSSQDPGGKTLGLFDPSIGHLTCFVGGMFALGSKIFNRPDDLDIAAKLTDGCVWAYESTETGIMPEDLVPQPCDSMTSCPWNETAWYLALDPIGAQRDEMAQKALMEANAVSNVDAISEPMSGAPPVNPEVKLTDFDKRKRQPEDSPALAPAPAPGPDGSGADDTLPPTTISTAPTSDPPAINTVPRTARPPTHAEFVQSRIEEEKLWPGVTNIKSRRYLLR